MAVLVILRSKMAIFGLNMAILGQIWPNIAKYGQIKDQNGVKWTKMDQNSVQSDPCTKDPGRECPYTRVHYARGYTVAVYTTTGATVPC